MSSISNLNLRSFCEKAGFNPEINELSREEYNKIHDKIQNCVFQYLENEQKYKVTSFISAKFVADAALEGVTIKE